jgi:hypothetical protein
LPPSPTNPPAATSVRLSRWANLVLFVAAILWACCVRVLSTGAAEVFNFRFHLGDAMPLVSALLELLLLLFGFGLLHQMEGRHAPLGLPRRATAPSEWAKGAAIGWGLAIAAVLPLALSRSLDVRLWLAPRAYELVALNLATLAVETLAAVLVFAGYPYHRLLDAVGSTRATLLLVLLLGLVQSIAIHAEGLALPAAVPVALLGGLLIELSWLRTHGLWLGWGIVFAWNASLALVFGLPIQGFSAFSAVVETRALGPAWLTGGDCGPNAAWLTALLLIAAIPILLRLTDDYAWNYTRPPLTPAGIEVTIAPPAAHGLSEPTAATQPATNSASPLVQILPTTPRGASVRSSFDVGGPSD